MSSSPSTVHTAPHYPYYLVVADQSLEQGDFLQNVPSIVVPEDLLAQMESVVDVNGKLFDAIVLSQSCDLASGKIGHVLLWTCVPH